MGLFDKLFSASKGVGGYFRSLTAYAPVFTTFEGGIYEMELTRAAIHSIATFCSKLNPEVVGSANPHLKTTLAFAPNQFMTTSQFLYRVATILLVENNAFIVPVTSDTGIIIGYYPIWPSQAEMVHVDNVPYLRFTFAGGERTAVEYSRVGHLKQFQFQDDFFGNDNRPLKHTLQLIHTQNEGIENAVKNSAAIRFLAKIANKIAPDKVIEARNAFAQQNLTGNNKTGLIVQDGTFTDFKQIDSKPYTVSAAQMKIINENVYNYFGINEYILQNKFDSDQWAAFYSGRIEPFAIQLSLVLTNMTYTARELAYYNKIVLNANRLQHMSDSSKMEFSTALVDRGVVTINEGRAVWGLPPVEGGDVRVVRREYVEFDKMGLRDLETKKELGLEPDGEQDE